MMNQIKRMRFTCTGPLSLGLLLRIVTLCSTQEVTIFPSRDIITVPSLSFNLMPGLPLVCGLKPETLTPGVNYTTRWILPGGEIVNSSRGRFVFSEGLIAINNNQEIPGTVLAVFQLSYQDAGTYTCEGRSTNTAYGASTTQWAIASFELQLNLDLLTNTSAINATMDDSTIELHCEMRAFIRPDSFLLWKGPGGRKIAGQKNKHQIRFSDGVPDVAANGSQTLVPSRVSTLTIINPEPSDSGKYTCSIDGVSEAVISIQVDGSSLIHDSTTITTQASVADSTSHSSSTLRLIGIILGSLSAVILGLAGILATAVCCVFRMQNKSRKVLSHDHDLNKKIQPIYDYVDIPALDHGGHLVRYSRQPDLNPVSNRLDQTAYDSIVVHDDLNPAIYAEIKENRERDDTYDVIIDAKNVSATTEVKWKTVYPYCNDYEMPVSGRGTLEVVHNVAETAIKCTNAEKSNTSPK